MILIYLILIILFTILFCICSYNNNINEGVSFGTLPNETHSIVFMIVSLIFFIMMIYSLGNWKLE